MEYYFKISEEEYLCALKEILRRRRKSILNILVFIIMTVGQLSYIVWSIATGQASGTYAYILLAISLLIIGMQVFYQASVDLRATHHLKKEKANGRISKDFWSSQHLTLKNDILSLRCGKTKLEYDCAYFQRVETLGSMLLLNFRHEKLVHQLMLPRGIFPTTEAEDAFRNAIRQSKVNSIRAGYQAIAGNRPEKPEYSVEFEYTLKNFVRDYVKSARTIYLTDIPWNLTAVAKLVATGYLLFNLFAGNFDTTAFKIFAVLVSFILCYQYLITFTPLIYLMAKKYAVSLFSGLDKVSCALDVKDGILYFSGTTFFNELQQSSVYALEKNNKCMFIYFKDGTSITVPITEKNSKELSRCGLYLSEVASANWANRRRKRSVF